MLMPVRIKQESPKVGFLTCVMQTCKHRTQLGCMLCAQGHRGVRLGVVMSPPLTPLRKLDGVYYGVVTPIGYMLTLFNNRTK